MCLSLSCTCLFPLMEQTLVSATCATQMPLYSAGHADRGQPAGKGQLRSRDAANHRLHLRAGGRQGGLAAGTGCTVLWLVCGANGLCCGVDQSDLHSRSLVQSGRWPATYLLWQCFSVSHWLCAACRSWAAPSRRLAWAGPGRRCAGGCLQGQASAAQGHMLGGSSACCAFLLGIPAAALHDHHQLALSGLLICLLPSAPCPHHSCACCVLAAWAMAPRPRMALFRALLACRCEAMCGEGSPGLRPSHCDAAGCLWGLPAR